MADEHETSPGGSPILRYAERRAFELPSGEGSFAAEIEAHLETWLGPIESVFHEILSDAVHIDVHHIPPAPDRPFHVLVTTGMSDRPMNAPPAAADCTRAELMVLLPPDWPIGDEAFEREENYWPIGVMKFIARFPHVYDAWVWACHTIPNGDPAEPYASNTGFCCMMPLAPAMFPAEFRQVTTSTGETISLLALMPLYREEMELKLHEGVDALLDRLDEHDITEVIDVHRPNVAVPG